VAEVAASGFLGDLYSCALRALRLKAFDLKDRKDFAKGANEIAPRVRMETSAPPASNWKHWKGNARRDYPACRYLCPRKPGVTSCL
jgi:hypothetical protein